MYTKHYSCILNIILRSFAVILLLFLTCPPILVKAGTSVCGIVSGTWGPDGNDYIVTCDIRVTNGTTLNIQPDVVVKFNDGTSLRIDGKLVAQGVTFTSSSASPTKGIWGRVYFTSTSVDAAFDANGDYVSGSLIQDSVIEWGGGGTGIGGAVEVSGAAPFLYNNTISNSNTRGVYATGRSSDQKIKITGNSITANSGGGVYVYAGELDNNVISANSIFNGTGVGVYATNSLLDDNEISLNTGGSGAGVYALGSTLQDNTISGNTGYPCTTGYTACFPPPARDGGGVYSNGSILIGNLISGNQLGNHGGVEAYGGGVYAVGGSLSQNTVTGNVVTSGYGKGGGIYSSLGTVTGNEVEYNTVNGNSSSGGGIYSAGASVNNNTVTGNTVNCASDETSYGGGIYSDGGTVKGNTVDANSASGGQDNQGGGIYGNTNTLSQNIVAHNSAARGAAIYSNLGTVTGNTVLTNTASLTGAIYVYQGTANNNYVQGNTAVNGGGLYGYQSNLIGNTSVNNTADIGGGFLASDSTLRGNTATGNTAATDGGGIYAIGGTITDNTLTGNTVPSFGHGSGAYLSGVGDFSYNSVLTNTANGGTVGGVSFEGPSLAQFNNLYGNFPYDAEVVTSADVTSTLNYWGLSTCSAIPLQIYDGHDAPGRGYLSYAPSLYQPSPLSQLAIPASLSITIDNSTVTLTWKPVTIPNIGCRVPGSSEPDVHYIVYYDTDTSCPPYTGRGLNQGNSPIRVDEPVLTLGGLGNRAYYFTVTAGDYLERESAYSNIVSRSFQGYAMFLPLVKR